MEVFAVYAYGLACLAVLVAAGAWVRACFRAVREDRERRA